ncbi:MAG TPA: 50S ribosomal protein L5 [Candidatus Nitrosotenuis sp.]|nr:50S ribosomal protein L5 [Candidatus Nitrosotenuis sp.]
MSENTMKQIRLEKVVLNMGVGKSGEAIEIAKKALDQITGKKSCARDAKATQRDWGVRKGEPIGVAVTVRGQDAATLLKRLFEAVGNRVKGKSFDDFGNVSFGIKEHIDIPGIKYDPQIGILGLEAAVTLTRPGFSIRVRSRHKASVGKHHRISKEEAIEFLTREFGVAIV